MWLVPLGDLTEDQLTAVQASTDRNRIIVGGPGSGKTLVLVHRAHQLILAGLRRDRVRVLVFTNVLRNYLREGLEDLGLTGSTDAGQTPDTHPEFVQYRMADLGPRECGVVAVLVDASGAVVAGFVRRRRAWYRRGDIFDLLASGAVRQSPVNPQFAHLALRAWDERTPTEMAESPGQVAEQDPLVQTFDAWVRGLYQHLIGGRLPLVKGANLDHELIRARVHAALKDYQGEKMLDAVLVDEGQDLSPMAIEIMAMASEHVTLAMDARQQIYDLPTDLEAACSALGVRRAAASLLTAYRCTPLIVDVAASFLPTEEMAQQFRRSTLLPIEAVETPVAYVASSDAGEFDELAQQLMIRSMNADTTAVLVPSNRLLKTFVEQLTARGLSIASDGDLDFGDLRPMVLTYHKAKGLTVDAVFLPRLTPGAFPAFIDDEVRRRLLFVGVTRATRWAWLGMREGELLPELKCIAQLQAQGSIKVKHPGAAAASPAPVPAAPAPSGDLVDLL